MTKKQTHWGRIQAQGGGLEASEGREQEEPLSRNAGLSLLGKLKDQLPAKQKTTPQLFHHLKLSCDAKI